MSSTKPKKRGRKQVKVACANCRRSKTACSDFRPCARCVRQGIPDQCVDAPRKPSRSKKNSSTRTSSNVRRRRTSYKRVSLPPRSSLSPDSSVTPLSSDGDEHSDPDDSDGDEDYLPPGSSNKRQRTRASYQKSARSTTNSSDLVFDYDDQTAMESLESLKRVGRSTSSSSSLSSSSSSSDSLSRRRAIWAGRENQQRLVQSNPYPTNFSLPPYQTANLQQQLPNSEQALRHRLAETLEEKHKLTIMIDTHGITLHTTKAVQLQFLCGILMKASYFNQTLFPDLRTLEQTKSTISSGTKALDLGISIIPNQTAKHYVHSSIMAVSKFGEHARNLILLHQVPLSEASLSQAQPQQNISSPRQHGYHHTFPYIRPSINSPTPPQPYPSNATMPANIVGQPSLQPPSSTTTTTTSSSSSSSSNNPQIYTTLPPLETSNNTIPSLPPLETPNNSGSESKPMLRPFPASAQQRQQSPINRLLSMALNPLNTPNNNSDSSSSGSSSGSNTKLPPIRSMRPPSN